MRRLQNYAKGKGKILRKILIYFLIYKVINLKEFNPNKMIWKWKMMINQMYLMMKKQNYKIKSKCIKYILRTNVRRKITLQSNGFRNIRNERKILRLTSSLKTISEKN